MDVRRPRYSDSMVFEVQRERETALAGHVAPSIWARIDPAHVAVLLLGPCMGGGCKCLGGGLCTNAFVCVLALHARAFISCESYSLLALSAHWRLCVLQYAQLQRLVPKPLFEL